MIKLRAYNDAGDHITSFVLPFDKILKEHRSVEICRPSDELGADAGTPDEYISSE